MIDRRVYLIQALAVMVLFVSGIGLSLLISSWAPDCNNWLEVVAGLEDCDGE